ncbi:oxidoreductase [Leucobacter sp. GX24907]
MPHPRYPTLLSPVRIGSRTLPNRAIMGSMHLGLEEAPGGFERMAAFYAERVRGGIGLIVTGGVSPNGEGRLTEHGAVLSDDDELLEQHRLVADAVHAEGGLILLQLLHAGRYAAHEELVGPSAIRAPINRFTPRELSDADVRRTVGDFAQAARLAVAAGYDGVEIMGSEGYLLNEFLAEATNARDDAWGGDVDRRRTFPLAVTAAVRDAIGPDALLSYRVSLADLVPGGSALADSLTLAAQLEGLGVDLFVTGIGWHEARIPTIATSVPRAAFASFTHELAARVGVPVAASNRINTPETAEQLLTRGDAELVSLARPLLADAAFVRKAERGDTDLVNTCIACNQACLDHIFAGRIATCLVNPRAGRETELVLTPVSSAATTTRISTTATISSPEGGSAASRKRVAVIGAGPAGLAAATAAAERGHEVELFEQRDEIGGQFDLARRIPGKEEFSETLRYFSATIERLGVRLHLGRQADPADLARSEFDEVIVATGVAPRVPEIAGVELPHVADYARVLRGEHSVGQRIVILGAGGIGFDVAEFLSRAPGHPPVEPIQFAREWGISDDPSAAGALTRPHFAASPRSITMLQRKTSRPGSSLGLTTGWIHRAEVQRRGVEAIAGVRYDEIVPGGIRITIDGESRLLQADTIVLCTGQESVNGLAAALEGFGIAPRVIGGALLAGELDAQRAIRQGTETAAAL